MIWNEGRIYWELARALKSSHGKIQPLPIKFLDWISAVACRLAEIELTNVNNTDKSYNVPYLEHIFPELPKIYLSRDINQSRNFMDKGCTYSCKSPVMIWS
jgi:hypothetical protein